MSFSLASEGRQDRLIDGETSRGSIGSHGFPVKPTSQLRFESDDGPHWEGEPSEGLAKPSSSFPSPSSVSERDLLSWNLPKDDYSFPLSQVEHYDVESHLRAISTSNDALIQRDDHSQHQSHRRVIDLDDDSSGGISTDRVRSPSKKRFVGKIGDSTVVSSHKKANRPGRKGSLLCGRCRKQKQGKRAPCVIDPSDPDGPCIPCKKAGLDDSCGKRTYPSRPKTIDDLVKSLDESNYVLVGAKILTDHDIMAASNPDPEQFVFDDARLDASDNVQQTEFHHRFTESGSVDSNTRRPEHGLDQMSLISDPNVTIDKSPPLGQQKTIISVPDMWTTSIPGMTRVSNTPAVPTSNESVLEMGLRQTQIAALLRPLYPGAEFSELEEAALCAMQSMATIRTHPDLAPIPRFWSTSDMSMGGSEGILLGLLVDRKDA